jgi:hypothetical protein
MSKLTVCFAALCMLAAPALGSPIRPHSAEVQPAPTRKPASPEELEQYKMRERLAEKLEKFEGGRGRGMATGTLIVILLVVIIILLII